MNAENSENEVTKEIKETEETKNEETKNEVTKNEETKKTEEVSQDEEVEQQEVKAPAEEEADDPFKGFDEEDFDDDFDDDFSDEEDDGYELPRKEIENSTKDEDVDEFDKA